MENYYLTNYSLIIIAMLITTIAQIWVSSSYKKYKKILGSKDLTGYETARKILDQNSLNDVLVLETNGNLTDHYDPRKKVVKLSTDIYNGSSIASLAVAAHECGHAIQDKNKYLPMRIRSSLVPVVNLCTRMGYLAIVLGFIFSNTLIQVGIILLLSMLLFQLITLPVEINASKRALKQLEALNLVDKEDKRSARKMLSAAAFTYIASLLSTLLEIFRYVLIFSSRDAQ